MSHMQGEIKRRETFGNEGFLCIYTVGIPNPNSVFVKFSVDCYLHVWGDGRIHVARSVAGDLIHAPIDVGEVRVRIVAKDGSEFPRVLKYVSGTVWLALDHELGVWISGCGPDFRVLRDSNRGWGGKHDSGKPLPPGSVTEIVFHNKPWLSAIERVSVNITETPPQKALWPKVVGRFHQVAPNAEGDKLELQNRAGTPLTEIDSCAQAELRDVLDWHLKTAGRPV